MGIYLATKTYAHNDGLSCCYRQWRATDNRARLHGYNLSIKMVFECHHLDDSFQTVDLATIAPIDDWVRNQFHNTTLIAADDPELDTFRALADKGVIDLRIVEATTVEKFAASLLVFAKQWMESTGLLTRATIRSVECSEHDGLTGLYVE